MIHGPIVDRDWRNLRLAHRVVSRRTEAGWTIAPLVEMELRMQMRTDSRGQKRCVEERIDAHLQVVRAGIQLTRCF